MNTKSTLLLLILVLMMGGTIWFLDQRVPTTRAVAAGDEAAFEVDRKMVDHIEIKYAEKGSLVLAVKDGFWRVTQPYDDVAQPDKVEALLEGLTSIELGERVSQEEFKDSNWKVTGLGELATKIRVFSGAESLMDFSVGNVSSIEGRAYVSLPKAADTTRGRDYLAVTALPALLKETTDSWRDNKLLRLPVDKIRSVKLLNGEGQIEVERAMTAAGEWSGWQLVKPIQARASEEQVSALLATLLNLEIVNQTPPEGGQAVGAAVGAPLTNQAKANGVLRVTVKIDGADPFEMQLQKLADGAEGTLKATMSHRKSSFDVQTDGLERLWCEPNALRDDLLARVDPDKAVELSLESSRFPTVELRKENQSWFLKRMGEWVGANGERVARVFKALNETRIREFTTDSAADMGRYGLVDPFLVVKWKLESGEETALNFGQNTDGTAFYVKSSSEPFVYRISAEVLPEFPPDALKWKELGVLRFSAFALQRIELNVGSAPTVSLAPDMSNGTWSGKVADEDITALLDRVKVDLLAAKLSRLNADDWSSALAEGIEALKEPRVAIRVTLKDPLDASAPEVVHRLAFAPTQKGMDTAFYYGRLDEQPDVFYFTRDALQDLLKPTFKDSVAP